MFNLSGSELVFLVLIALVVLGPDKLPEAMRKAGKAYADFKKMTSGFQSEMRSVLDEPMRELRETAELAKKAASWDTNMFDTGASSTKPVSGSMAAQTPVPQVDNPAQVRPAEPEPVATPAPSADAPAASDPTSRRLQASSTDEAEAEPLPEPFMPFSPNFSSAAPRVPSPTAESHPNAEIDETDEVSAE